MECQGKMPRAVTRKAESTDVHVCGGLPRSSVEASVMGMERMLFVLAKQRQAPAIFRLISEIDPHAFVSQSAVIGVYGEGFDKIKYKAKKEHGV